MTLFCKFLQKNQKTTINNKLKKYEKIRKNGSKQVQNFHNKYKNKYKNKTKPIFLYL